MKELYGEAAKYLSLGEDVVAVTIISSSGSTPRRAGSGMLVRRDGSIRGSIGGGAVEYQAIQAALQAMEKRQSCRKEFSLTRRQAGDIGMVCGGDVAVYFQYISHQDREFPGFFHKLAEALEKEEEGWAVLDITDEANWTMEFIPKNAQYPFGDTGMNERGIPRGGKGLKGCPGILRDEAGKTCFIWPVGFEGKVYIFGGGHVAQELVPVLSHVGFSCVVMDDREEFAGPELFPDAERTVVGDLERIDDYVSIKEKDYVCIMTRGHQYDYYVQKQVMPLHPCYIGVMGSKNKIRVVGEKLMGDGFSREELDFCHMPIGTAIAAETPEEIAISIAGEMIRVRAMLRAEGKSKRHTSSRVLPGLFV